jgi:Glycosyltransferase family 87
LARSGTQRPDTAVFGYPPWIDLAFLPVAPLPLGVGSLLWSAGTLSLACLAVRAVTRRFAWGSPAWPLALAGLSWPAFLAFVQGQWAYLLLALACIALLDLDANHDFRAGTWWAIAVLVKPQLFVVGSIALLAWAITKRRWAVLIGAALIGAAAIVAGTLASPGWVEPYLREVVARRAVRSTQQPTLAGLAGDVAAPVLWPIGWVIFGLVLFAAAVFAIRRSPPRQRGAVAFASILVVSVATACIPGVTTSTWSSSLVWRRSACPARRCPRQRVPRSR